MQVIHHITPWSLVVAEVLFWDKAFHHSVTFYRRFERPVSQWLNFMSQKNDIHFQTLVKNPKTRVENTNRVIEGLHCFHLQSLDEEEGRLTVAVTNLRAS
jgi:hypothetical protein